MKNLKKSKCKCWSCKLSPKIRRFEKSLSAFQQKEFRKLFNEVWDREEAASMDLNVLEAKIDGSWPKEESDQEVKIPFHSDLSGSLNTLEGYYHRVGGNLYWIKSVKIKSKS